MRDSRAGRDLGDTGQVAPHTSGASARTARVQATRCEGPARDRRPVDRAVRQDPAAGDRPPRRRGRPRQHRAVRRARTLPRAHPHLPDHPAGAVERAGRRARRRAGRRRAGPLVPLPGAAGAAGRRRRHHGPVRPAGAADPPRARADHGLPGSGGAGGDPAAQEDRPDARRPDRPGHGRSCTRRSAATSSRRCSRSAGRPRTRPVTSTARRTRSSWTPANWHLRSYQEEAVEGFWAGGSGVVVLPCGAGKTLVGAAAMAKAGATTLILVTNTVAGRQWRRELLAPHVADRGGDRRVLRRAQGDPPGHHRHLPGDDPQVRRRLQAPGPVRLPRLGPGHLRRGAPAAGAGLPDDGRPAVPPPARADGHPGPRGRPGGRRVLADRAEAVRRAVEGHRVAGLDRAGRVHRGAGDADRRRAARPTPPPSRRSATRSPPRRAPRCRWCARSWTGTPASRRW